jgi:YVTN family beta-propeller protein
MKKSHLFFCVVFLLITSTKVFSQTSVPYVLEKIIPLSGDDGYDFLTIDSVNHRLYITHDTRLNVVDLNTEKEIAEISDLKGVHGVAIDNETNNGFITDGDVNAIIVFDLGTFKKIATIPITGKGPDAILYDPSSKKILAFNGDNNSASIIDPVSLKQTGTIDLGGAPEFAVAGGNGKIYNNVEDKSVLNIIDSKTLMVINKFPLAPCGKPTGLAFDATSNRLFTACRLNKGVTILDATSGNVIMTLPIGAGVDAVVYDPSTKLIFCSCGDGTTTVIKQESADKYSVFQTITTQAKAKTIALDTKTHKIYLSVADRVEGTKKIVPGTFKLLVYKMQ